MSAPFIPLVANWNAPVRETLSFLTDIFTSNSGREQRRAQRRFPRRDITFDFLVSRTSTRALMSALNIRSEEFMRVPDFTVPPAYLAEGAAAGSTTLQIYAPRSWMSEDQLVGFVNGFDTFSESVSVPISVTDFSDDFNEDFGSGGIFNISCSPLSRDWPAGTMIYPLTTGRITDALDATFNTDTVASGNVSFREKRAVPNLSTITPTRFVGFDVFEFEPNWSSRPRVVFSAPSDEIDFSRGVTKTFKPISFNSRSIQFSYLGINRDRAESLRDFFIRQKGRQGEFWCPSFVSDMEVTIGVAAGSVALRVLGTDIADHFDDTVHKAVCVNFSDGTKHYAQIVDFFVENSPIGAPILGDFNSDFNEDFTPGYGLLGQQTYIQLAQAFPVSKRKSEISSVSWLYKSRFGSDDMIVEWVTSNVVRIVVNVTSLESL